jgi:hypothetical protein
MNEGLKMKPFVLILALLCGMLLCCGDSGGSKSEGLLANQPPAKEPYANIKYTGDLKKGHPIWFNGSDSNSAEYYRWSYKEASQADGDYRVLDANASSIALCFIKASDYNVKLEIRDGVDSVTTLTIEDNVIGDQYNRVSFHNNADGTYSTTLSFNSDTYDIINDLSNDYIYFDFACFDSGYNSMSGYSYYQYLLHGTLTLEDGTTVTAPCFIPSSDPLSKTILENTAPGTIDDILMDANFLFTKDELQKAYDHNMLIIYTDKDGDPHMAYIDITAYLALTDDNVADFSILDLDS